MKKICSRCNEDKDIELFYIYKSKPENICKSCHIKRSREFVLNNYFDTTARKTLGNKSKGDELKDLFYQQNSKCFYSGRELILGVNASIDHLVPTHTNTFQKDDTTNIVWCETRINESKNGYSFEYWLHVLYSIKHKTPITLSSDYTYSKKKKYSLDTCRLCKNKVYKGLSTCELCYFKKLSETTFGTKSRYAEIIDLYNNQNKLCALTNTPIGLGEISCDHILPRSTNPELSSDINNIRLVQKEVNTIKWTMTDSELLQMCNDVLLIHGK